jgi:pimeloyl-ACP methyl ester carboxylesterase
MPQTFELTPAESGLPGPLHGLIDLPTDAAAIERQAPVVVLCHGFKGFAGWAFFPPLAALLAARGFAVVRFDFRGAGMALGEDRVTDLQAFREQTITGDVADLLAVVAALPRLGGDRFDLDRLGLLGHSRGGGAAIVAAARPELRDRLGALVTWAAVSRFDRLPAEEVERWRRTGSWLVVNARTGQELPVGLALLRDVESHREALDVRAAAARRRAPWLIVHGERDETVPVTEGDVLAAAAAPPCELLRLPEGDHTFGARHPFASPTPALIAAMNATQSWLIRHLR